MNTNIKKEIIYEDLNNSIILDNLKFNTKNEQINTDTNKIEKINNPIKFDNKLYIYNIDNNNLIFGFIYNEETNILSFNSTISEIYTSKLENEEYLVIVTTEDNSIYYYLVKKNLEIILLLNTKNENKIINLIILDKEIIYIENNKVILKKFNIENNFLNYEEKIILTNSIEILYFKHSKIHNLLLIVDIDFNFKIFNFDGVILHEFYLEDNSDIYDIYFYKMDSNYKNENIFTYNLSDKDYLIILKSNLKFIIYDISDFQNLNKNFKLIKSFNINEYLPTNLKLENSNINFINFDLNKNILFMFFKNFNFIVILKINKNIENSLFFSHFKIINFKEKCFFSNFNNIITENKIFNNKINIICWFNDKLKLGVLDFNEVQWIEVAKNNNKEIEKSEEKEIKLTKNPEELNIKEIKEEKVNKDIENKEEEIQISNEKDIDKLVKEEEIQISNKNDINKLVKEEEIKISNKNDIEELIKDEIKISNKNDIEELIKDEIQISNKNDINELVKEEEIKISNKKDIEELIIDEIKISNKKDIEELIKDEIQISSKKDIEELLKNEKEDEITITNKKDIEEILNEKKILPNLIVNSDPVVKDNIEEPKIINKNSIEDLIKIENLIKNKEKIDNLKKSQNVKNTEEIEKNMIISSKNDIEKLINEKKNLDKDVNTLDNKQIEHKEVNNTKLVKKTEKDQNISIEFFVNSELKKIEGKIINKLDNYNNFNNQIIYQKKINDIINNIKKSLTYSISENLSDSLEEIGIPVIDKYLGKVFDRVNVLINQGLRFYNEKINVDSIKNDIVKDNFSHVLKEVTKTLDTLSKSIKEITLDCNFEYIDSEDSKTSKNNLLINKLNEIIESQNYINIELKGLNDRVIIIESNLKSNVSKNDNKLVGIDST